MASPLQGAVNLGETWVFCLLAKRKHWVGVYQQWDVVLCWKKLMDLK